MVLAIGIVVDDAIVVLENVERHHARGQLPRRARPRSRRCSEVTGPIIAIVLVLCAVFVPIAFLGGLTGELYRQFAVTISIAVVISGLVALTLTPALCALILKHDTTPPSAASSRWFNRWFARVTGALHRRRRLDDPPRRHRRDRCSSAWWRSRAGLWRITPGSLVPDEDQGFYISAVILPDGATLERTDKVVAEVEEAIRSQSRTTQDVIAFTGFDFLGGGFRNNAATIFVTQKHWDERKVTAPQLVGELFVKTAGIKEALVLAFNPPPIFGLGTAGGFEFYIQNRGDGGAKRLNEVTQQFLRAREPGPGAGRRADAVARQRAAALRRRRPREGEDARRADRRHLQRAVRHARHLLRQRLQQVRPRLAGADVGRAGVPQRGPTTSARCTCARTRAR